MNGCKVILDTVERFLETSPDVAGKAVEFDSRIGDEYAEHMEVSIGGIRYIVEVARVEE